LKNEKLLVCAILVQLLLGCAFTLLVEYGNESNGAFLGNSLHGVFVQVSGPKSGKNSLPNSYYSNFSFFNKTNSKILIVS
jgi:hypothetical protein